jgi:hypothetical protein
MTPSEAYELLITQTAGAQIQTLVLGSKTASTPIALNRVQLTKDLAKDFSDIARKAVPPSDEISLLPYAASYNPGLGEVMYISLDKDVKVKPIIDDLIAFQNIEHLKSKTDLSDNLRFYAVVYGVKKDNRIALIRTTSEKLELSKGARLPALLRSGTFSKLKQQVFLFDRRMDGAAAGGYFFIFNKGAFEKLFQYYEELRANAENTVNLVTKYIPVSNLAEFKTACTTQVRFMDKLASVSRSPYLASITIEQIKAVIKEFDLSVPIIEEDGVEKIVFEKAPQKRWDILKLLDDDYLRSVMTNEKYAANSKLRLSAK